MDVIVEHVLAAVSKILVAIVQLGIEGDGVGIGAIERVDARDQVIAALCQLCVRGGFFIALHQKDVGDIGLVGRELHYNRLFRLKGNLIGVVQILDGDLHRVLSIVKRKALLVDKGASDFRCIGENGTVKGDLGVVANHVTLFEDGLDLHGGLELSRLKLVIDHAGAVKGESILDKRFVSRNTIGRV